MELEDILRQPEYVKRKDLIETSPPNTTPPIYNIEEKKTNKPRRSKASKYISTAALALLFALSRRDGLNDYAKYNAITQANPPVRIEDSRAKANDEGEEEQNAKDKGIIETRKKAESPPAVRERKNPFNVNYETYYDPWTAPVEAPDTEEYMGKVAFTFDGDYWGSEGIDTILEALDRHNVKSTFFLTGRYMEKYPKEVKRIVNSGHEVANHSYDHDRINSPEECNRVADIFKNLTGEEMTQYFRVPYLKNVDWREFNQAGWEEGYVSLITGDALPDCRNLPNEQFKNAFKHYVNTGAYNRVALYRLPKKGPGNIDGSVILMHINANKLNLLDWMIDYVKQKGYTPVKFSGLANS